MDKIALRKQYRLIRQNIPESYRMNASQVAQDLFINHPLFKNNARFAAYIAVKNEFDVYPMIQAIWEEKKLCYLPVLATSLDMHFALYEQGQNLLPNRYQIPEPVGSSLINTQDLNVVFVPLIAFDREGHRIGTGGGYYDRTFTHKHKTKLIGVGFAAQEAKYLPSDAWDVLLDGVLTEKEFILF